MLSMVSIYINFLYLLFWHCLIMLSLNLLFKFQSMIFRNIDNHSYYNFDQRMICSFYSWRYDTFWMFFQLKYNNGIYKKKIQSIDKQYTLKCNTYKYINEWKKDNVVGRSEELKYLFQKRRVNEDNIISGKMCKIG